MSIRHHRFTRVVLPLVCAAAVMGTAPASAQENEPTVLQRMLGGLGLLELPKDPIHYRERPPLVVPPSSALIAPQSVDDIAQRNPDWPVDHDRKQDAPLTPEQKATARKAEDDFYSGRALLPNQLGGGPRLSRQEQSRRNATTSAQDSAGAEYSEGRHIYSPEKLGFKGWGKKQETVVFAGEPERRSLTDPPPGLRTPSADAPYGVVTTTTNTPKAVTIYDRVSSPTDPNIGR